MRVMITGGTGFIGYHTALALLAAGHKVRLLVRSEEKLRRLFGDTVNDFVVGDVTDSKAVTRALRGCDAVVHTAAMVSVDEKDAELVMATNVGGTELVIGGAVKAGVARIIHVSSVTALYDPEAEFLNEYSEPGTAENAYGRSKVECERYVRALVDRGAPIHITYPASVIGPEDPALTDPHIGLMTYLNSVVPIPPSGNQWVDVRDVAAAHVQLLSRNLPPGRYTLGGHFITWNALVDVLRELTGRKLVKLPVPGSLLLGLGIVLDRVARLRGKALEIPVTHEAMTYATNWIKMDNTKSQADLELRFRPLETSLVDAILSLVAAGHLKPELAGKLYEP